jgi:hypothetical protein
MQFTYSNSNNYLAGAKEVNDISTNIYNTARQTGVDVNNLIQTERKARATQKLSKDKATETIGKKAVNVGTDVKLLDMDRKLRKDVRNINKPAKMAGALAATVDTGNAYLMYDKEAKLKKKENEDYKAYVDSVLAGKKEREALSNEAAEKTNKLLELRIQKLQKQIKGDVSSIDTSQSSTDSSVAKPQTTSVSPQSISTIQPTSYTGTLDTLSPEDKKYISFGVSAEAARGTADEFAVAGVILNRMKNSGKSAKEIIYAPNQFEAVTGHNPQAHHDPVLQKRLFGKKGLPELEDTINLLDGRTQFRGQTLLHKRGRSGNPDLNNDGLPDLDLMVHPKGNFFFKENQV